MWPDHNRFGLESKMPIEEFLKAFSNTLEDEEIRLIHQLLLENLEQGLDDCGAPCPCPADL